MNLYIKRKLCSVQLKHINKLYSINSINIKIQLKLETHHYNELCQRNTHKSKIQIISMEKCH